RIHQWAQTGHVGYLSNWSNLDRITDAMVVVPREGPAILLVAGVEYMLDQIAEVSWLDDVRLVSSPDPRAIASSYTTQADDPDDSHRARSFGAEVSRILHANGYAGRPIGLAGVEALPVTLFQDLSASAGGGIADVPDIVADLRQWKSDHEVSLLRQVAAISDRSYQTMIEALQDGIWGYELTAEMDHTAKGAGADFVYHCMHTAPGGDLKTGKLSIKAHDCRLEWGDYINVNAYVVYKGYWIQSYRAGTMGREVGGTAGAMLEANLAAQDEVRAAIRPGLPIGELVRIADASARRRGYEIHGGRIGHGQGLDYAERPFLLAGSRETLQPRHVFVLHVCLGLPGANVLLNPIADLCAVTPDGVEVLNRFPRGVFHA